MAKTLLNMLHSFSHFFSLMCPKGKPVNGSLKRKSESDLANEMAAGSAPLCAPPLREVSPPLSGSAIDAGKALMLMFIMAQIVSFVHMHVTAQKLCRCVLFISVAVKWQFARIKLKLTVISI